MCRTQALLIFICLLASCTVGPNYNRPGVTLTPKFKEAKGKAFKPEPPPKPGWKLAEPKDLANRGKWWKLFCDPELNALEEQLNQYNQSIANALANYEQAKALVYQARASYFPIVSSAFNIFRQKQGGGATTFFSSSGGTTSTDTAATGATGSTGSTVASRARTRTTYSAFLTATWEPDIWGLVRRTVEGNVASAQANQALIAATALSAQGSLAQYYFQVRSLDRDQQLLNDTVRNYKKALVLTRNRYEAGVASRADIVQAQSQLENAKAQAINNGILRSQYEHAIAVLMGRPPATFRLLFRPLRAKPPIIPISVPSVWLERRPDVAQAERLMQQANAQIGVACAAYYPNLTLSATASAAARSFSKLLTSPSIGWSAGLQIAQTIFDGGLRWATVMAAKAGYVAQIASYRQTVLAAFQDVEDNLVALRLLRQQVIVQNAAAASANKALELIMNQYKSGIVPFSTVIIAQITAFTAQKAAYDVAGLQMTAAVRLIKALGGGWSIRELAAV
ncbi:MAG: efflux transporter outer membrane subunit [Tatlockia sp.]|nr:efflux transporter outer membrane subunit [Tatlockia sp.]